MALRCLNCGKVTVITGAVVMRCGTHCFCMACYGTSIVTVTDDCPACRRSLQAVTQPCSTCHTQVSISEIFTFDCGHLICSSCYPPSPQTVQRCQFCLLPCSVCNAQLSKSELNRLICGHFLCVRCEKAGKRCEKCLLTAVFCEICGKNVEIEQSFPLECGKHSICLWHLTENGVETDCRACFQSKIRP